MRRVKQYLGKSLFLELCNVFHGFYFSDFCALQMARDPRTNTCIHSGKGLSVLRTSYNFQAIKLSGETMKPLNPTLTCSCYPMSINFKHFQRPLYEVWDCACAQNSTIGFYAHYLGFLRCLKMLTDIQLSAKKINDLLIPEGLIAEQ